MKCPNCGNEFEGNFCPKCGNSINGQFPQPPQPPIYQNQPFPQKKKKNGCLTAFIVTLCVIGALSVLAAIGKNSDKSIVANNNSTDTSDSTAKVTAENNKWDDKFDVKNLKLTTSDSDAEITGEIVNKTDKQYQYLQIEFNLYDKSGAQIDSTFANINNLEPNGTWKFKAYSSESGVKTIKIKDVTGC